MQREPMRFGLLFMSWLKIGSWGFWRDESLFSLSESIVLDDVFYDVQVAEEI
jgi:hypothetical protein